MAKKAKAKKADALPKSVAGVKVPRAVRKSSALRTLLNSSLGREILADALLAAAGAAAAALTRTRPARAAGAAIAEAGSGTAASAGQAANVTGDLVQTAAGAVAGVVTEAARNILPPSLLGEEAKPRYVNKASHADGRKRSKKDEGKKRSRKKAG